MGISTIGTETSAQHTQQMNRNPVNGRLNGFTLTQSRNIYDVNFQATNKKVHGHAPCSCSGG